MHQLVALVFLLVTAAVRAGAEELGQSVPAAYPIIEAVAAPGSSIAIRGLLKTCPRNTSHCQKTEGCCPTGGDCCGNNLCCPAGQRCIGSGHCCYDGQVTCGGIGCCPYSYRCCDGRACCPEGYYCAQTTSGTIYCCENGKRCSGPPVDKDELEGASNGADEVAGNESKDVEASQDE